MKKSSKVVFSEQTWKTFKTPPESNRGHGPSGNHIWIYDPINDYISMYYNWSGIETKQYKRLNYLWVYVLPPESPKCK